MGCLTLIWANQDLLGCGFGCLDMQTRNTTPQLHTSLDVWALIPNDPSKFPITLSMPKKTPMRSKNCCPQSPSSIKQYRVVASGLLMMSNSGLFYAPMHRTGIVKGNLKGNGRKELKKYREKTTLFFFGDRWKKQHWTLKPKDHQAHFPEE